MQAPLIVPGRCESRSPNGRWLARYIAPALGEHILHGMVELSRRCGPEQFVLLPLLLSAFKNADLESPGRHMSARRIVSFCWSPCGEHLAIVDHNVCSVGETHAVHLWKHCTNRERGTCVIILRQDKECALRWSPDSSRLWTGSYMWCLKRNGHIGVNYHSTIDTAHSSAILDWTSRDASTFRTMLFHYEFKTFKLYPQHEKCGWYEIVNIERGEDLYPRQNSFSLCALSPDRRWAAAELYSPDTGVAVRIEDWRTGEVLLTQYQAIAGFGSVSFMFADNTRLQMYTYDHSQYVEMDLTPVEWLIRARAAAASTTTGQ
jgi:hypothetical protein